MLFRSFKAMSRFLPLLAILVAGLALATTGHAASTSVKTRHGKLGTFLVDGQGRTLYLWDADHGPRSTCTAACAQAWPPLTTTGAPKASGAVKSSLLGTATRADGSREVTYAGHPLYTYAGDTRPGQVTGEGSNSFGAPWWTVTTAGRALQGQPM